MIGLSIYLSRGQSNKEDYYLGGNKNGAISVAISTMATQCSTTSILGAPAFVAFSIGGGLIWLQYELAVPLAMIFLMVFLLPLYRKLNIISVYAYLEKRFDKQTRLALSLIFQVARAVSTGVTVYGISLVLSYCMGVSFLTAALLLGVVTIIYDSIGGMRAVIVSDVIQMIILYIAIISAILTIVSMLGGFDETLLLFDSQRLKSFNFGSHGFNGDEYSFFPMLIGGFFLYISYYGCDQSQVQRELSTKNVDDTNTSLFLNGILRFPLVLTYCFLGVCIGAYVVKNPDFIKLLPLKDQNPNYDLSVPVFVLNYFPKGLAGLVIVGLFSAAMSSLDSAINSLSATSMQDIFRSYLNKEFNDKQELLMSKILTIFWGSVCTVFAFFVGDISDSVIVSINKIGSLANGPVLGVFLLGVLTTQTTGRGALGGLVFGLFANAFFWIYLPMISWVWWNVIGCVACFCFGLLIPQNKQNKDLTGLTWMTKGNDLNLKSHKKWKIYYIILVFWFFGILGVIISL